MGDGELTRTIIRTKPTSRHMRNLLTLTHRLHRRAQRINQPISYPSRITPRWIDLEILIRDTGSSGWDQLVFYVDGRGVALALFGTGFGEFGHDVVDGGGAYGDFFVGEGEFEVALCVVYEFAFLGAGHAFCDGDLVWYGIDGRGNKSDGEEGEGWEMHFRWGLWSKEKIGKSA